ncbi:Protein kinase domain containing protein [Reticulomyxa filosa]|uniref:Protein kinase domain containing protein n=1 Tax=Reticulomyxa filosa TaxID=46433 RepID=X6LW69_RETFI|nr:Protein kinase domain containing protein [Reticulomyxa filosa]|eukprot:ETO05626.1 Protein kinase domain containing protein [Reticulomyxa filosa]
MVHINSEEVDNEESSETLSTDTEFGEEDLPQEEKKFETPNPSTREISNILNRLETNTENSNSNILTGHWKKKQSNEELIKVNSLSKSQWKDKDKDKDKENESEISSNNNNNNKVLKVRQQREKKGKKEKSFYINQYLCYKQLGKGTFGNVVLAKDISKNRKMAIKIINKSSLKKKVIFKKDKSITNALEHIYREISIMQKLNHPNTLKLYEVIDDSVQDQLFLVASCFIFL